MNHGNRRADELYRSLFDRSGLGMARLDREARVLEANTELLGLLGRPKNRVHGADFARLAHPGTQVRLRGELGKLATAELDRFTERTAIVRDDGAAVPSIITAIATRGDEVVRPAILVVVRPAAAEGQEVVVDENTVLNGIHARILEGLAAGDSALQLANQLYMSRQGIDYHVSVMLRKLRVPNRTALVSRAFALGLLSVGIWPPRVSPAFREMRSLAFPATPVAEVAGRGKSRS